MASRLKSVTLLLPDDEFIESLSCTNFTTASAHEFAELNGAEVVNDYGDWLAEHAALRETAGVFDFSFRARICLVGADRVRVSARAGDERREKTRAPAKAVTPRSPPPRAKWKAT